MRVLRSSSFAVIGMSLLRICCLGQAQRGQGSEPLIENESLKRFLQTLYDDKTTRYSVAFTDLNRDRTQEAIVYLEGNGWCGSGGCNTLILAPDRRSWRIVTKMTVTQLPIRVLANISNGWHNIGVWVQGGGIQPGYEAELKFDGKTYPGNPSTPHARHLTGKVAGKVVISSSSTELPLYP
ncbi:MAG TPA: hypothetical protein VH157_16630 [Bryobacteraceae bacterium]|nr:hypothetical protein [Bryobacteraceae bacterium]